MGLHPRILSAKSAREGIYGLKTAAWSVERELGERRSGNLLQSCELRETGGAPVGALHDAVPLHAQRGRMPMLSGVGHVAA